MGPFILDTAARPSNHDEVHVVRDETETVKVFPGPLSNRLSTATTNVSCLIERRDKFLPLHPSAWTTVSLSHPFPARMWGGPPYPSLPRSRAFSLSGHWLFCM